VDDVSEDRALMMPAPEIRIVIRAIAPTTMPIMQQMNPTLASFRSVSCWKFLFLYSFLTMMLITRPTMLNGRLKKPLQIPKIPQINEKTKTNVVYPGIIENANTVKNKPQGNKKYFIISNPPYLIIYYLECKCTPHPVPKLRTPLQTLTSFRIFTL
jgi:hypothetical protein